MSQEKVLKLLAGASMVAKSATKIAQEKSAYYIEEQVLKGKYVTREEFNQLQKLVQKLEAELRGKKTK